MRRLFSCLSGSPHYKVVTVVLFLLVSANQHIGAQTDALRDSLLAELPKQRQDTNKILLLQSIIRTYAYDDPEKQLPFIKAMLQLSKELKDYKGEAKANLHYASYYSKINNWPEALKYLHIGDSIYKKHNDEFGLAYVNNFMGNYYKSLGKLDDALVQYHKALTYYEKTKNANLEAGTLIIIAMLYSEVERYEDAEKYLLRALELRRETENKRGMSIILQNLGSVNFSQQKYDKAEIYFNLAMELQKEFNDLVVISKCQLNQGFVYSQKGEYKKSLDILEQAYFNLGSIRDTFSMGIAKLYEANTHKNSGQYKKSIQALDEAMVLIKKVRADSVSTGDVYLEYYQTYKKMGDYKNALAYYEKAVENRSEIFSVEKSEKISELKEKYETEKKEQENLALKNAQEIQDLRLQRQWYFIYGLAGILFLIILISILFIRNNKIVAEQKTMRLEQKMLRSQMNPHFIFNALIAIQSFMFKSDPKTAGKFLSSFAKLMRGILENSREEYISLSKEISWMEHYIELQRLRFDNIFEYEIKVDEHFDTENTLIPPMLTQPFIENALEHGLSKLEKDGMLKIFFSKQKESLHVEIIDNGAGFDPTVENTKTTGHVSMATKITTERLQLLNRGKSRKIHFTIHSRPGSGTRIEFSIPYRTKI